MKRFSKQQFYHFINMALPDFFKQKVFNHFRTKIVIVFLAIFLWFYVVTEEDYTYALNIPIRIINIKTGKVIENDYPKSAKVLFWGKGRQLLGLLIENDIEIILNLKNVNHLQTKLKKEHIYIPRHNLAVEPLKIVTPDSIEIRLINLIKKKVPIIPDVTILPVAGHTQVGDVKLFPDSLWISGPVSRVEKIHSVSTEHLDLRDVKRGITQIVGLKKTDLPSEDISVEKVSLTVDVQKLMEKTIQRVPVQVYNLPAGTQAMVIPPHLSLTLEGGVQVLANLTEKDIVAYIDYRRKLTPAQSGHPAIIQTPAGVAYRDVNPQTFRLVIERTL